MRIRTIRYGDNFIYLLLQGGQTAVVDPGAAAPVREALEACGATLSLILLTHYHGDHTEGCNALKRASGCRIAGPAGGSVRLDEAVTEGDALAFAGTSITVLPVPGHTAHDVAYYLRDENVVFTGDTLFAGGCGRLFSGNAAQMWASLLRLRELPAETRVYGGHDYTLDNLKFALHLEPDNTAIQNRLNAFESQPKNSIPSASTIAEECLTNPFLRCDVPSLVAAVGLSEASPSTVFAEIRHRKDLW
jgi:hydroxyacylglutathione hydrolase